MFTDMSDFLNRSIMLGDDIVYATRQGSSLDLTLGHVVDCGVDANNKPFIKVVPSRDKSYKSNNPVILRHSNYIVVVENDV